MFKSKKTSPSEEKAQVEAPSEVTTESIPAIKAYSLTRKNGGWLPVCFTIQGDKVTSVEAISEPDMLPIAQSKLNVRMLKDSM